MDLCISMSIDDQDRLIPELSHSPDVLTADVGVLLVLVLLIAQESGLRYQDVQPALLSL